MSKMSETHGEQPYLEPGTIVKLKSDGPKMTVKGFDQMHGYYCEWFDNGDWHGRHFYGDSLEPL